MYLTYPIVNGGNKAHDSTVGALTAQALRALDQPPIAFPRQTTHSLTVNRWAKTKKRATFF